MSKRRALNPKPVYDESAVKAAFQEANIKETHVVSLFKYLFRHPEGSYADVPELPRAAVELLESQFARCTSRLLHSATSRDGGTTKLLLELQDGLQVEAVVMHYDTTGRFGEQEEGGQRGHQRATLCVSSQVGCQMGCTFCATGTMGLKGNLWAGEIIEQLVHARRVSPIRNVVFMGMGEPLNNYDNVRSAVGMMVDPRYLGLRRSAVTVSTVGVTPRMLQMVDDMPGVSLALSLHAPNQALRQTIVPSAKAYKLDKLMAALETYQQATKQKVFVEYVMLAHINDGPEQAHELGALLKGRRVTLNLIPWNPVLSTGMSFEAPGAERVAAFQGIVREQYGLQCTVRQEKGQDIGGACGQLVVEAQQGGGRCGGAGAGPRAVRDIEEIAVATVAV